MVENLRTAAVHRSLVGGWVGVSIVLLTPKPCVGTRKHVTLYARLE